MQDDQARYVASLVFTGRGSEYFRLWVVNVMLSLLTLGLYSPWAKVRKARYFRNNTQLDGHVFDYHGRPVAILRGRIVAMVLLAAYTWASQLSNAAGLLTIATLCAVGPWLFMRAQQFSLSNTSFRGLRFGFRAKAGDAYATALPVLALWLSPRVAAALTVEGESSCTSVSNAWCWLHLTPEVAVILTLPWMHHRLKAYQRRNAFYGARRFSFRQAALRFYWIYAQGTGLVLLGGVLGVGATFAVGLWLMVRSGSSTLSGVEMVLIGSLIGLFVYVTAWPYLAARLQQVVWSRTELGDISFRTDVAARPLFRVVFKNMFLTLLTGGLYWPWATVALARYRIECIRVESDLPLSMLAAEMDASVVTAAGEGASDAFGFDIGL